MTSDETYLADAIGGVLTDAIKHVISLRPEDPIRFIAHYIRRRADGQVSASSRNREWSCSRLCRHRWHRRFSSQSLDTDVQRPFYQFILWPPSLSFLNMGRERRWPRWIKKGVAYWLQATVVFMATAFGAANDDKIVSMRTVGFQFSTRLFHVPCLCAEPVGVWNRLVQYSAPSLSLAYQYSKMYIYIYIHIVL